jgi:hypothetical protein
VCAMQGTLNLLFTVFMLSTLLVISKGKVRVIFIVKYQVFIIICSLQVIHYKNCLVNESIVAHAQQTSL